MNRSSLLLAILVAVTGLGAWPGAAGATQHAARGSGQITSTGGRLSFSFRAVGTPSQATGHATFEVGSGITAEGTVDCLAVQGRRAALTGELAQPINGFTRFKIVVKDNGPTERRPGDEYSGSLTGSASCTEFLRFAPNPIRRGEIRVS